MRFAVPDDYLSSKGVAVNRAFEDFQEYFDIERTHDLVSYLFGWNREQTTAWANTIPERTLHGDSLHSVRRDAIKDKIVDEIFQRFHNDTQYEFQSAFDFLKTREELGGAVAGVLFSRMYNEDSLCWMKSRIDEIVESLINNGV